MAYSFFNIIPKAHLANWNDPLWDGRLSSPTILKVKLSPGRSNRPDTKTELRINFIYLAVKATNRINCHVLQISHAADNFTQIGFKCGILSRKDSLNSI